jgi:hypothetical protein
MITGQHVHSYVGEETKRQELDINGRIILKLRVWIGLIWFSIGAGGGIL